MEFDYKTLQEIENEVGDSWYFLDIERFKSNYQEFLKAFQDIYPQTQIAYSYKTNYIPLICKTVDDLGGFAEVVSDMEYSLALDIGVEPKNIVVNGPYKPEKELKRYLLNGSMVNVDSFHELDLVMKIVKEHKGINFSIGIRCNFEIEGYPPSRFGVDVSDARFEKALIAISKTPNLRLESIHCHYPYRDVPSFLDRVYGMIKIYDRVSQYCSPKYIDIGGGLGGKISKELMEHLNVPNVEYADYANIVAQAVCERFKDNKDKPILLMEPGTALVADAMAFFCKILNIKDIRGRKIAFSSGSRVNFHSRTSKVNLPIRVFSKSQNVGDNHDSINIGGYTCMEEDYIYRSYSGSLGKDDYIAIDNVGSYSIVFKPPFINPNVPVVASIDNEIMIIKRKETYDDVFKTYIKLREKM